MRTLKKYLHWTSSSPETQSRSYLFFPVGARGSICIDLQRPEGVLCGRIEFAILFRFDPTYHREYLAPFGKTTFTPLPLCPERATGYIRASVYILFMVSRYTRPDDENRAHGGPAPWNSCPADESGRGKREPDEVSVPRRDIPARWARCSTFEASEIKPVKKNLPGDYLPLYGSPRTQRYRYFHARVLMPRREIRPNALYNFSLCQPFERN